MSNIREWSREKPPTEMVKDICNKVKPDIERMAGTHFEVYYPLSFACQTLSGETHYVVKMHVGVDVCVHVMISVVLISGGYVGQAVKGVQHPKVHSDPLVPF